ncbi:Lrp/AsnC family transcriptional regulator [Candidatus Micrarchaeota archaeon]|nr:Lrp/AsnC family transcriptional regulator [Candidatus Micrarchaeota archaeon]
MQEKAIQTVRPDLRDKKLLREIDFHARLPYSELARRIGTSKQGAEYKFKNLLKQGVIRGSYPVVNVPKLGYLYCRLLVTLQGVSEIQIERIVEDLKKDPNVFWLFTMEGRYDLLVVFWAKNVSDFKRMVTSFLEKHGKHVKRKVETVTTDVCHLSHRYLLEEGDKQEVSIRETDERIKIDELDKRILTVLASDARIPLIQLASAVDALPKTVAYRMKRMEKEKLILCYRPIIDHSVLGLTYYKLFVNLNSYSLVQMQTIKNWVKQNKYVTYIVEGSGLPTDLDLELIVPSNKALFEFIRQLRFKFPRIIGDYSTVVFKETRKVRYLPF